MVHCYAQGSLGPRTAQIRGIDDASGAIELHDEGIFTRWIPLLVGTGRRWKVRRAGESDDVAVAVAIDGDRLRLYQGVAADQRLELDGRSLRPGALAGVHVRNRRDRHRDRETEGQMHDASE